MKKKASLRPPPAALNIIAENQLYNSAAREKPASAGCHIAASLPVTLTHVPWRALAPVYAALQ
jgi:hypothetical protein